MKFKKAAKSAVKIAGAATIALTCIEIVQKIKIPITPTLPSEKVHPEAMQTKQDTQAFINVYRFYMGSELINDDVVTEEYVYNAINKVCTYINLRFDCADFRAQLLFRIYKDCNDELSDEVKNLIKKTLLDFKYFIDEPGDDTMCYWSENHQILFAVSEYLAGQEWKNEVFSNSGMTGYEHKIKAQSLIEAWMKQRFDYDFSEYLSNVYILEDLAPMANFIQYCEDKNLVNKMKIIMDLLWFNVALHTVDNRFVSASSRMYGNNKSANFWGNSVLLSMSKLWGTENLELAKNDPKYSKKELELLEASLSKPAHHMGENFLGMIDSGAYELPTVIKNIALCKNEEISKMSVGLSTKDMVDNDLIGQNPNQIMAQWGAETFTQPEVINNSMKYIKDNNMFTHGFVFYYKFFDLSIIRPWILKNLAKVNIMPHGIALGRGNVYCYKNAHYSMSTLMAYEVDLCGDQQHIFSANIAENLALYTTHPTRDDGVFGSAPGYYIGNGRNPMSVQNKSVNLTIYKIPKVMRVAEIKLSKVTHAYMPKCFYDEFELNDNVVFARRDKVFVALISNGELKFRPYDKKAVAPIYKETEFVGDSSRYEITSDFDLVHSGGHYHIYVTELSSADKETFDEFKARIASNKLVFDGDSVIYESHGDTLQCNYRGEFLKNSSPVQMNFSRYDCDYCKSERGDEVIEIDDGVNSLRLNFDLGERFIS